MTRIAFAITLGALGVVGVPFESRGYDIPIHRQMGLHAAREAGRLDAALKEDLGVAAGREAVFEKGIESFRAEDWVSEGAGREDVPAFLRPRNHFHNPLLPWESAGLRFLMQVGQSSVLWSQNPRQSEREGGVWSWPVARRRYLDALTGKTQRQRGEAFADTFRALGHVTHLVQDATVPAHTRNDWHYPPRSDVYEDWVQGLLDKEPNRFEGLLRPAKRPFRLVLHSENAQAPVPIAGLIDTDTLVEGGVIGGVLSPPTVGVGELTNANFVSRDTIFKGFALPSRSTLGPRFLEPEGDAFRGYFPKMDPQTGAVEIPHFLAETALYRPLSQITSNLPGVAWTLTPKVHEDYARELLPRAVGYSAELLDYFFRGRLDVDVVADPTNPAIVSVVGVNGSPEPLYEGTLSLFADLPNGDRVPTTPLATPTLVGIGAGEPIVSVPFALPADAERFVAVYRGALGQERPNGDVPGAVVGKALGGVRVEEVFASGDRWRLRTPVAVFDLPLSTETFADVRWGDGDDTLVAWTEFVPDEPAAVVAYTFKRPKDSAEPILSGTPLMVRLDETTRATLPFAVPPLVTTIEFDQTIRYRQQIGQFQQVVTTKWMSDSTALFYDNGVETSRTAPVFEPVHEQTVRFVASIPIRLDAEHNLDVGFSDEPYYWELVDVAADRDGRLVGLVAAFLTAVPAAPVTVPWYKLDAAGQMVLSGLEVRIQPSIPADLIMIWALVDLASGEVLASTTESVVTLSSVQDVELAPWQFGGGLYRRATTVFVGGPLAGTVEEWIPSPPSPRSSADGVPVALEMSQGDQALTATGWMRDDLRDELTRAGLLNLQPRVRQSATAWNYLCLASSSSCASETDYSAFVAVTSRGAFTDPIAQFLDVRRARPAPSGERLAILADSYHDGAGPSGSLIVWDPGARRARLRLQVADGFHNLVDVTGTAALLFHRPRIGQRGTLLIALEPGGVETFFAGVNLGFGFTLLAPDHLYSTSTQRFYRGAPPLTATPLPARLSPVAGTPFGDYHAIRLP